VEEETPYVKFAGYIGKPKLGKKTRGEQFLFVNRRFIRSPYLYHAVKSAYEEILPEDHFPFFVIFLEIHADKIDVNVHPTKQEIKFEDDRIIYNYLRVACRHALGKYSVTPSLNFEQEVGIERANSSSGGNVTSFHSETDHKTEQENIRKWASLLESIDGFSLQREEESPVEKKNESLFHPDGFPEEDFVQTEPVQLWHRYILLPGLSEMILVDQRAAHERVLFQHMMHQFESQSPAIQKLLWPETIQPTATDSEIIRELLPHLQQLGFDISEFGHGSYIIHGIPALMTDVISPQHAIEEVVQRFTTDQQLSGSKPLERIAASLASGLSRRRGELMSTEEMKSLVTDLMASSNPYTSPTGRKTFITFGKEEIFRRFQSSSL
jgi:DNA mismatch repair protein MutL